MFNVREGEKYYCSGYAKKETKNLYGKRDDFFLFKTWLLPNTLERYQSNYPVSF